MQSIVFYNLKIYIYMFTFAKRLVKRHTNYKTFPPKMEY